MSDLAIFATNNGQLWSASDAGNQPLTGYGVTASVALGGIEYFLTSDGLWKTDGTAAGTEQIAALNNPRDLLVVNGALYLLAGSDPALGYFDQVFRSDGVTTTQVTATGVPMDGSVGGFLGLAVSHLHAAGHQLFFNGDFASTQSGWAPSSGGQLYGLGANDDPVSLGYFNSTPTFLPSSGNALNVLQNSGNGDRIYQATLQSGMTEVGPYDAFIDSNSKYLAVGDSLYFTAHSTYTNSTELFAVNASGLATQLTHSPDPWMVDPSNPFPPQPTNVSEMAGAGSLLFFVDNGVLKTAGADGMVHTVAGLQVSAMSLAVVGDNVYFVATDSTFGHWLARTSAAAEPATFLTSLDTASGYGGGPLAVAEIGDTVYFTMYDGNGLQLWTIDPDTLAPVLLSGNSGGFLTISNLTAVGDHLVFSADDGLHGTELWTSDGTAAGTVLAQDIEPSFTPTANIQIDSKAGAGGSFAFATHDAKGHVHLWATDLAHTGASELALPVGVDHPWTFTPGSARVSDGALYFTAEDSGGIRELFKASTAGVTQLTHTADNAGFIYEVIGDATAQYLNAGNGLFKVSASAVSAVTPHTFGGGPVSLQRALFGSDGDLYFVGTDNNGTSLFKTDGSTTTALQQLTYPLTGVYYTATIDSHFYFSDYNGSGLYRLDPSGLTQVAENYRSGLQSAGGSLYYIGADSGGWSEVFKVTAGAPVAVTHKTDATEFNVSATASTNGQLYFVADSYDQSSNSRIFHLYHATAGGNVEVANLGRFFGELVGVNGAIYYTSDYGLTLFKADANGVTAVPNAGYQVGGLTVSGNELYFSAADSNNGRELWRTDGTAAGTTRVTDTQAAVGSDPHNFVVLQSGGAEPPDTPSIGLGQITGTGANVSADLSGAATPGSSVDVYDGTTHLAQITATSGGAFSLAGVTLAAGAHTFTAVASNAGGTSAASAALVVEVDTAANVMSQLNALANTAGLAAIWLTDTHVLPIASQAAMQSILANDAAALSVIVGEFTFAVTATTGANQITVTNYDSCGCYFSTVIQNFSSGDLVSRVTNYRDGASTVQKYTGGELVSDSYKFPPGGDETSYTKVYKAGVLYSESHVHSDNSRDVFYVSIPAGRSYVREEDHYNASNVLTSATRLHADSTIDYTLAIDSLGNTLTDQYDSTGAVLRIHTAKLVGGTTEVVNYDAAGVIVSDRTTYAPGSADVSDLKLYTAGVLTRETVVHSGGAQDVYLFNISGRTYVSEHDTYDAAGQLVAISRAHGDGSLDYTQTVNAFGDRFTTLYQPTGSLLKSQSVVFANGNVETKSYDGNGVIISDVTKFAASAPDISDTKTYVGGILTTDVLVHDDGSKDVDRLNISDKSYVAQHDTYRSDGTLTSSVRTHSDSTLDYSYTLGADLSKTTDQYDSSGAYRKTHSVVWTDGSRDLQTSNAGGLVSDVFKFAAGGPETSITKLYTAGVLTSETDLHADGSKDVYLSNVVGKTFTAEHDVYSAAGVRVSVDQTLTNGTHKQVAYQPGVTLTSTQGVVDLLQINGSGGDTLVFHAGSGSDTVLGFHAGSGANHDTITLYDQTGYQDFNAWAATHLHSATVNGATNVTIDVSANDHVMLRALTTALTSDDFHFV